MNFAYLLVLVLSTSEPSTRLINAYPDINLCKTAIIEMSERKDVELRCMKVDINSVYEMQSLITTKKAKK